MPGPVILAVVGTGAFVTALDQTVVVTALPSIIPDLKIPSTPEGLQRASWIITAFLLGYTSAMPLLGRIADVYGYARIYQASLVIFSAGTILVAVSPNLEWIVAARVVQAIGGGATVPIGMALASTALPSRRRGLAIGLVVAAAEAGAMLGPAYGGAIIEALSWRWIFWLNVPQAAVLLHRHVLAEGPPSERSTGGLPGRAATCGRAGDPLPGPVEGRSVHPILSYAIHNSRPGNRIAGKPRASGKTNLAAVASAVAFPGLVPF